MRRHLMMEVLELVVLALLVFCPVEVLAAPGGAVRPGKGGAASATCTPASGVVGGCLTAAAQSIGGVKTFTADAGVRGRRFVSTVSESGASSFECNSITNSSPCLYNPDHGMEIFSGFPDPAESSNTVANFLFSSRALPDGGGGERTAGYIVEVFNLETPVFGIDHSGNVEIHQSGGPGQLTFKGSDGRVTADNGFLYLRGPSGLLLGTQSAVTAGSTLLLAYNGGTQVGALNHDGAWQFTGVATGDLGTCNAGLARTIQWDTTAGALKSCDGSAWRRVLPVLERVTLSAGAGTAGVPAGLTQCQCTDETAAFPAKCSVSGTTLTVAGEGSDVINAACW